MLTMGPRVWVTLMIAFGLAMPLGTFLVVHGALVYDATQRAKARGENEDTKTGTGLLYTGANLVGLAVGLLGCRSLHGVQRSGNVTHHLVPVAKGTSDETGRRGSSEDHCLIVPGFHFSVFSVK